MGIFGKIDPALRFIFAFLKKKSKGNCGSNLGDQGLREKHSTSLE
jgi:hypothetical protein